MTTTLIDADTLIFLIAYNHRDQDNTSAVLEETDIFVELILENTGATHYLGFLGGSRCFRYAVAKHLPYKGKRAAKPDWFTYWEPHIRARLLQKWKFIVCDEIEAEDGVSICANHYRNQGKLVIAHVDKDLNDIEGTHYDYRTHQFYEVDWLGTLELNAKRKCKGTGRLWFWAQMIIGDKSTDNIEGLKGKGDVFAYELLKDCTSEEEMMARCKGAYLQVYAKDPAYGEALFAETLQLIGMLTAPAYGFVVPLPVKRYQTNYSLDELEALLQ